MTEVYTDLVEEILRGARRAGHARISLVSVMWRFDWRSKIPVSLEEINQALANIDWIVEEKEQKELFFRFTPDGTGRHAVVSKEDFHWADQEYRRRFWEAYRKLDEKDQPSPE